MILTSHLIGLLGLVYIFIIRARRHFLLSTHLFFLYWHVSFVLFDVVFVNFDEKLNLQLNEELHLEVPFAVSAHQFGVAFTNGAIHDA